LELVSAGGEVNGVVQWIALILDEATHYENCPGPGKKSAWVALFHSFARGIETAPGEKIRVFGCARSPQADDLDLKRNWSVRCLSCVIAAKKLTLPLNIESRFPA
jgi:hypothetical protein